MKSMDVKPWLVRMSEGDEEAFQAVYEATSEQAYRMMRRNIFDKKTALRLDVPGAIGERSSMPDGPAALGS